MNVAFSNVSKIRLVPFVCESVIIMNMKTKASVYFICKPENTSMGYHYNPNNVKSQLQTHVSMHSGKPNIYPLNNQCNDISLI